MPVYFFKEENKKPNKGISNTQKPGKTITTRHLTDLLLDRMKQCKRNEEEKNYCSNIRFPHPPKLRIMIV